MANYAGQMGYSIPPSLAGWYCFCVRQLRIWLIRRAQVLARSAYFIPVFPNIVYTLE